MSSKDSKMNFAALRETILAQGGKKYWRSVEEFVDAPEFGDFVKQEYPQHAETWDDSLSRRNFVKVMGASLALAGLSGCVIQPAENIVPYVKQPDDYLPGTARYYATATLFGGVATGVLAKSYEGRPVKLEGNPEHPASLGATDLYTQAELLEMYDADRAQFVTYRGETNTWKGFLSAFRATLDEQRKDGGAGVRFLSETITSPSVVAQFKQIQAELPNSKWIQYEPVNCDNVVAGAKLAFGSPSIPVYKFDVAERILAIDADFLGGQNVRYIKDFSKGRAISEEKKEINRLYAIETTTSLTGAKADHRLAVKPSQIVELATAVAKAVGVAGADGNAGDNAKWIEEMAKDLSEHKGKSLVVAGNHQSAAVHALAFAINSALGNIGQTVTFIDPINANAETSQTDQLRGLISDIDAQKVKMLVVLGGNPCYNTPIDLRLTSERMNAIATRIHLSSIFNETSENCYWHVNQKHTLESWGDARAYDGTVTLIQPLVQPLYEGKSVSEIVQACMKEAFEKSDLEIVKDFWKAEGAPSASVAAAGSAANTAPAPVSSGNFEDKWQKLLHDGFVPGTASAAKTVTVSTGFLSGVQSTQGSGMEFVILPDPSIFDGKFTNNGWLQELPNPLTKITWENVGLVSPKTAVKLGLNLDRDVREQNGGVEGTAFFNTKGGNLFSDLVNVTVNGAKIGKTVPVWVAPGQPDDVVTLFLGYGRTRAGRVGNEIGYNAYDVRKADSPYFGTGEIAKTGERTTIASTQLHFNMEGRDLLRMWDVEEFEKNPAMGHQHDEYEKSMYERFNYSEFEWQHKWGMTIDLNSCVGCNACVVACQSENNIPVVGKEQVERSREMHWMRIDAYYSGDVENPIGPHFQPVLCQQCELAPCEVVCPVHATVHSAEGLNDMVYNRCVGTRYCSNNCPYKVRRFNFLLYQDWTTPSYKLMRNPEVSIRSRGVMEKCTYCTQRISAARIEAQKEGRRVKDGEVVTACQSVCPADAIVFGDLNDKESKVAKLKKDHRNYNLLNELNTQPRTTYLAGLKNFNKVMPDYKPAKKEDTGHAGGGH